MFELDSGRHHDHMVCIETGRVVEFSNEEIERLQRDIASRNGYELVDHSLVLYVKPKVLMGTDLFRPCRHGSDAAAGVEARPK